MRAFLGPAIFVSLASMHSPASAKDTGVEVAGRIGYGVPFGQVASDPSSNDDMQYWFASQIVPLQLDAGYRLSQRAFVGGYFSYGTVQTGDVCDSADFDAIACDSRDVRAGVLATYHFSPPSEDAGWIGAGIGYEWLTIRQNVTLGEDETSQSHTFHGLEATAQAGYDFSATDYLRIGPYAQVSVGRFSGISSKVEGEPLSGSTSEDIDDKARALHGWVMFGLKASFGPF